MKLRMKATLLRTLITLAATLLAVPVITNSAAAPVERSAGNLLVPKTVWCDGFWNGCGELCPSDAPQFETRRPCTINGQTAYEYWCCYSS
ncbi:hypothetical protein F5J12DRAFT_801549 [Pisolithus orientalis]|uniref:uncharacterized protein n=1 Tax=Pisolithus orientalis TaxID=936130 RepID=UPI0022242D9B|nr:uncharacterized protein F5J12DRAFT_801549 [Pisolithus orientalis]KAI6030585.1 hypothetical protein F5J12DRAFT_801549 [Pisolithus orientalis]